MTIATTSNKVVCPGNGAATSFTFNFLIPDASSLKVIYTDPAGNQTTLASSQYNVVGLGSSNGGTVTYPITGSPIATGASLTILRQVPIQQTTSLVNQSGFYPDTVEAALDNLTMQMQQVSETVGRGLVVPVVDSTAPAPLPSAAQRAGMSLGFDSNGNPIVVSSPGDSNLANPANGKGADLVANAAKKVASIAALRALRIPQGSDAQTVILDGYSTAGDGGGGVFQWFANSSTADDDGIYINPTGNAGNGRWVRADFSIFGPRKPRWYGAKGDGTTDDTSAIQACITAVPAKQGGYVVKFDAGVYIISATLVIQTGQRITLEGEAPNGSNATILKTSAVNLDMVDASTNLSDTFSMRKLQLQGAGSGSGTGRGVLLGRSAQSAYDSRIEHCWFTAIPTSGLYAENMQGYHISNCGFENSQYGINIQGGSDNVIINNRFYANTKAGVNIAAGNNNSINSNHLDSNGTLGDDTTAAIVVNTSGTEIRNTLIATNNFSSNKQDIALTGAGTLGGHTGVNNTSIIGNTSDFAQRRSIYLNAANGTRLIGNTINDSNQANASLPAIEVAGASDRTIIADNVVTGAAAYLPTYGVTLGASSTNTALGLNKFNGSSGAIQIATGATLIDMDAGSGWQFYSPTIAGATTPGSNTYSVQSGNWRITGKQCEVYITVTMTAKDAAMAGAVHVPLPATSNAAANWNGVAEVADFENVTVASGNILKAIVPPGTNYVRLLLNSSGAAATVLDSSAIGATTTLILKASYPI